MEPEQTYARRTRSPRCRKARLTCRSIREFTHSAGLRGGRGRQIAEEEGGERRDSSARSATNNGERGAGCSSPIAQNNNRARSHVKRMRRRCESRSSEYSYGKYLRAKLQGIKMRESRGKLEPRPRTIMKRAPHPFPRKSRVQGAEGEGEGEEGGRREGRTGGRISRGTGRKGTKLIAGACRTTRR